MTLNEFLNISRAMTDRDAVIEALKRSGKPEKVGKHATNVDMNAITYGELVTLQTMSNDSELMTTPCKLLLGMSEDEIFASPFSEVLSFSFWVATEVERINKLFAKTHVPPTSEELQAGCDKMNFGAFGIIDWFARRMGISNHEEVERVPWARIYKCLEMQQAETIYQRKLQKLYTQKKK